MDRGMRNRLTCGLLVAFLAAPATAAAQVATGYGPLPEGPPTATTPPVTQTQSPPVQPQTQVIPGAPVPVPVTPEGEVLGEDESGPGVTANPSPPASGGSEPTTTQERGAAEPATAAAGPGSLPFTGLEAGFVVGAGLLLVAAGLVLRRTRTN